MSKSVKPVQHRRDDHYWARFMLVLTTSNQIWVRFGKHLFKFRLSGGDESTPKT